MLLICLLAASLPVRAIIIRHDSASARYVVNESDYPAVFYLEMQASRKVCVATLIDSRWAITAAHCLHETSLAAALQGSERFTVLVAGQPQTIAETVVHPNFGSGNFDPQASNEVDLALLKFEQPLDFPRPIPLYALNQELSQIVTLLGWGFYGLGSTGRQYDDGRFRRAENRITEASDRLAIVFDDPRVVGAAALPLEGMPGLGDSGGPALLLVDGTARLAGVLVGEVMDSGFDEETQGRYESTAVYERISQHRDWINSVISGTDIVAVNTSSESEN